MHIYICTLKYDSLSKIMLLAYMFSRLFGIV